MKSFKLIMLAFTLTGMFSNTWVFGGDKSVYDIRKMDAQQLIALIENGSWRERDIAAEFARDKYAEIDAKRELATKKEKREKDQIALALIKLLEKVNSEKEKWWVEYAKTNYKVRPPTPEGGEIDLRLIDAVMSLKDKRSLKALVGAVETGNDVRNAVADFGKEATELLTESYRTTKDKSRKGPLLTTLAKIVKKDTLGAEDKAKIRALVEEGLLDPDWDVRYGAVRGIEELGETSFIPLLYEVVDKENKNIQTKNMKGNILKTQALKIAGELEKKEKHSKNKSQQLQPSTTREIKVP